MLFGGSRSEPNAFVDTWEFDGTRWERVATEGPPALVHHAMQYDPTLRRVACSAASRRAARTSAKPGDPRPHGVSSPARRAAGGGRLQGVVIGAGPVRRGVSALPVAGEPSPRYLPDVAYDEKRNVMVLFGGGDSAGMALFDDTWELDGTTWRQIPGTARAP